MISRLYFLTVCSLRYVGRFCVEHGQLQNMTLAGFSQRGSQTKYEFYIKGHISV